MLSDNLMRHQFGKFYSEVQREKQKNIILAVLQYLTVSSINGVMCKLKSDQGSTTSAMKECSHIPINDRWVSLPVMISLYYNMACSDFIHAFFAALRVKCYHELIKYLTLR